MDDDDEGEEENTSGVIDPSSLLSGIKYKLTQTEKDDAKQVCLLLFRPLSLLSSIGWPFICFTETTTRKKGLKAKENKIDNEWGKIEVQKYDDVDKRKNVPQSQEINAW